MTQLKKKDLEIIEKFDKIFKTYEFTIIEDYEKIEEIIEPVNLLIFRGLWEKPATDYPNFDKLIIEYTFQTSIISRGKNFEIYYYNSVTKNKKPIFFGTLYLFKKNFIYTLFNHLNILP